MNTAAELLSQSRIGRRASRARRAKPDGGLAQAVIEYLTVHGIRAYRMNSGSIRIPADDVKGTKERLFKATFKGCPDVMALIPSYGTVWIEAKGPRGNLRPDQVEFRNACLAAGVPHVVCRTLDDLDPYLPPARRRA